MMSRTAGSSARMMVGTSTGRRLWVHPTFPLGRAGDRWMVSFGMPYLRRPLANPRGRLLAELHPSKLGQRRHPIGGVDPVPVGLSIHRRDGEHEEAV